MKKLQKENKQANISSIQTSGMKNRPSIENVTIMNAIIKKQTQYHKNTFILFADA